MVYFIPTPGAIWTGIKAVNSKEIGSGGDAELNIHAVDRCVITCSCAALCTGVASVDNVRGVGVLCLSKCHSVSILLCEHFSIVLFSATV